MATRIWEGDAVAIAQVTTIAVTGTWAQNDTATLTINGKDLTVTIGTAVAIADVVAAIVAAWNASTATADLVGVESRNIGGAQIAEMNEITASGAASPITLTGDVRGVPFTVTASVSTAGNGDLGSPTEATAPTGPNHFDNADNWSDTTVPVDADDIVFDSGDVDVLYGTDQNAVSPASVTINNKYTGKIGLPKRNSNGYEEYREDYLKLGNSGDATTMTVTIGQGPGSGSGRIKLDAGSGQMTTTVIGTGSSIETGLEAFLLTGTHASNVLTVHNGSVGVGVLGGETSTLLTITQNGGSLRLGSGVTVNDITKNAGTLISEGVTTTGSKTLILR